MPNEPERADSMEGELLVSLKIKCPACGKPEPRRIAKWRAELYKNVNPEKTVETITCKCGAQYGVAARFYQGAA